MKRLIALLLLTAVLLAAAACSTQEAPPVTTAETDYRTFATTTTAPTTTTAHTHIYTLTRTAATCTAQGQDVYTCPCGDTFSTPLPQLEHVFTNWVVIQKAYYMEDGIRESTCDLCGVEKKTETFPLSEKERREWDELLEKGKKQKQELINKHAESFMGQLYGY